MTTFTPQQLAERRTRIHASDAPLICGVSPFGGPRDVWFEKIHGATIPTSEAMDIGNRLEPMLLDACREILGAKLRRNIVRKNTLFAATLDAMVLSSQPRAHVEAKYRSVGEGWGKPDDTNAVPDDVLVQTAVQFYCAKTEVCWVPAMVAVYGRPKLRMYRVERDEGMVTAVVDRCREFWDTWVVPAIEPPGVPPGMEILKGLNRTEACERLGGVEGQEVDALLQEYESFQQAAKDFQDRREEVQREIIARMGDHEGIRTDSWEIGYRTIDRRGYAVKPSSYRKFTYKRART
jgi:predicted phage-related endonuclease